MITNQNKDVKLEEFATILSEFILKILH